MRTQSASERQLSPSPTGNVTVLSVSPLVEDHVSLQAVFGHTKWILFKARDLASACALLQQHEIAVVICEGALLPWTWRDVLEHVQALPNAPSVIVTSRLADDRLWAEALNLGAWDVLARPFVKSEVYQAVSAAWRHWRNQQVSSTTAMQVMRVAGWGVTASAAARW